MQHAARGHLNTRRGGVITGATLPGSMAVLACLPGAPPAEPGSAPSRAPVTVSVHARVGAEDEASTKRLAEVTVQNPRHITAVYEGLTDYYVNLIVSGTAG